MKTAGLSPDAEVAAALVRAHYAQNSGRLGLKVLYDLCGPTRTRTKSILFGQLGYLNEEGDPTFGPFMGGASVVVFNAVLQCALPRQGFECVSPILQLMQLFGVPPSSTTVEILLSCSEKNGVLSLAAFGNCILHHKGGRHRIRSAHEHTASEPHTSREKGLVQK